MNGNRPARVRQAVGTAAIAVPLAVFAVWALADNTIALRFYRAMGGAECGRCQDRFCGVQLEKIGFAWS